MLDRWKTDRVIFCVSEDGERVTVFRQHSTIPDDGPRRRFVLANSQDVVFGDDSRFRVLQTGVALYAAARHQTSILPPRP